MPLPPTANAVLSAARRCAAGLGRACHKTRARLSNYLEEYAEGKRQPPAAVWGYAVLLVLFAALYGLTATQDYTFDAVSYALQIERFQDAGGWQWVFHPHHVLFNAAGSLFYRCLRVVWHGAGPLAALQAMNALLGALGVALFARFAGRICGDRRAGLLAAAGLGLSYGYWTCSTDGRVNLAGVVVLVGTLPVLAELLDARRMQSGRVYVRCAAALGGLHALAMLLHQSHALFGGAALLAISLSPGQPRRRALAVYAGVATGVTGFVYLVAGSLASGRGLGGLWGWAFRYAHQGWWWNLALWGNLLRDARAFAHALVASPWLSGSARGGLVYYAAWLLLLAGVAGAVGRARLLLRGGHGAAAMRAPHPAWGDDRGEGARDAGEAMRARLVRVFLVWLALYAGFFTFWNPGYFVFWVPLLVPFWGLMAVGFAPPGRARARRVPWRMACAALLLMAANNAAVGIAPHAQAERNGRLQKTLAVAANTRANDVLVVAGAGDDADAEVYLPYFARRETISVLSVLARSGGKREALQALHAQIDQALRRRRRVFVYEELLSGEAPYRVLESRQAITRKEFIAFLHRHYRLGNPTRWRRVALPAKGQRGER